MLSQTSVLLVAQLLAAGLHIAKQYVLSARHMRIIHLKISSEKYPTG